MQIYKVYRRNFFPVTP